MSRSGYVLEESDLLPLSLGAALLGTGGGGNPYIGMLRARELLRKGASVEVLPLEAIGDDDFIGSVGGIGAPVVGIEKIKQGQECFRALRAVEEAMGVRCLRVHFGGSRRLQFDRADSRRPPTPACPSSTATGWGAHFQQYDG